MLSHHRRDSGALVRQDIRLFDFRNGRGSAGDLDSLANNSAKDGASQWRDIGYGAPCGFCFILTNDAECLRPTVIAPHGYCGPEMHFTFIGCWFDDLGARSSCNPIAKFAPGSRHRRPVVFSYCGLICCFETGQCPLDCGKTFSGYEVRMRRHRSIRQIRDLVLDFLNKRAAHCVICFSVGTCGQHPREPSVPSCYGIRQAPSER
jgi:hypothetical protein